MASSEPDRSRVTRRWLDLAGLAFLALIWGTQFLVIRVGQETVPPLLTVTARFAVFAVVAHAVLMLSRDRTVERPFYNGWRLCFALAQAAAMSLLYIAERHVPSSAAALLFGTTPLFVAVLAHALVPGERLRAATLTAAAIGFAGVALAIAGGSAVELHAAGALMAVAAALAAAINKIAAKRVVAHVSPLRLLRDMAVLVSIVTGAGSWLFERDVTVQWTPAAIAAALYLGLVASALASTLYLLLLRRLAVTALSYLQVVTTVVGVLTGVVIGGEPFAMHHVGGAVLVVVGLAVLLREAARTGLPAAPPAGVA